MAHHVEEFKIFNFNQIVDFKQSDHEISHHLFSSSSFSLAMALPSRNDIDQEVVKRDNREVLMEIIQSMPESCFELSLRDIIDHQHQEHIHEEVIEIERAPGESFGDKKSRYNLRRRKNRRNSSMDSRGFQLKMFSPAFSHVFFNSKKQKKEMDFSDKQRSERSESSDDSTSKNGVLQSKFPCCWQFR